MSETAVATDYSSAPTLLLALGSHDLTEHFSSLLRNAGYGVIPAGGPSEARRVLDAGLADMALVDVEWGTAAVTSLAESAHASERPCPVAVVVGWWDVRTGEVLAAADTLVYKPPTQRQLLGAVQQVLAGPAPIRLPA